jgi:O-methyltransferase involved in polyketide biosynthesis
MSTTRTDDDSWDIAPSIGATAVMVATPELAEIRANVQTAKTNTSTW